MLYAMMTRQDHRLSKMAAVWLLPVVSLIVASSSGGLLTDALKEHSLHYATLTSAFSFTMVIMGLSLALIIITVYFLRLTVYGTLDAGLILSAFVVLGPLGQGGYSLLINGEQITALLPSQLDDILPYTKLIGRVVCGVCFCAAYALW